MESEIFFNFLNHIVFPYELPKSASKSYPKSEGSFLSLIKEVILEANYISNWDRIFRLFVLWEDLQISLQIDPKKLNNQLLQLKNSDGIALYLHNQNVCLIIQRAETKFQNKAIISYFQASVDNNQVMSNLNDIQAKLPLNSIPIENFDTINSTSFAELLADLANNKLSETSAVTKKAGTEHIEVRDIAETSLISKWLFPALTSNSQQDYDIPIPIKVTKKYRDEVNLCKGSNFPFRRSGIWMCIKGVLEILLCNLNDDNLEGLINYKIIMILVLEKLCRYSIEFYSIKDESLRLQMLKKLARRVFKLNQLGRKNSSHQSLIQNISSKCYETINLISDLVENKFKKVIFSKKAINLDYSKLYFKHIIHKNPSKNELDKILQKVNTANSMNIHLQYVKKRNLLQADFPDVNLIDKCEDKDALGIHLFDIENWIFNRSNFEFTSDSLFELFCVYTENSVEYYANDQLGYSRMTLACLILICCLDKIAVNQIDILSEHEIGIDMKLIESLLLPKFEHLTALSKFVTNYIQQRNKNSKFKSLIDSDINEATFAVRYSKISQDIQDTKNSILNEAENKRFSKIRDVNAAQLEYMKLFEKYSALECFCQRNLETSIWLTNYRLKSR